MEQEIEKEDDLVDDVDDSVDDQNYELEDDESNTGEPKQEDVLSGTIPAKKEERKRNFDAKRMLENIKSNRRTTDRDRVEGAFSFLVSIGLTNGDINRIFKSQRNYVILTNKDKFQEIKAEAMARLENRLMAKMLEAAIGYDYTEESTIYRRVKGAWKLSGKKIQKKHMPGNANLFLSFMYNRFPENWKQSSEVISKKIGYDTDPALRTKKFIESLGRTILEGDTDKSEGKPALPNGTASVPDECAERPKE